MLKPLKTLAIAAGLAAAPLAVAVAQTTLDFTTWQSQEPGFDQWWKGVIAEFEAKHPGTRINVQEIPFAQYNNQLTVRFAGNKPPDIVHLPTRNFAAFASQGWLEPIDDVVRGTAVATQWSALQDEMKWDGKTQGVLLMAYSSMLFYNQKILDDAKVAVPKTPQEFLAAIEKTTDREKGIFGFAAQTVEHPNIVIDMGTWVMGQGQDWVKGGKYAFTDPQVVPAIEQYRRAVSFAPKGTNSAQARQLFIDGKVAFLRDGPWVWGSVDKAPAETKPHLKVTAVPFPVMSGGTSNSLHMPAKIAADKRRLVGEFITLVTSPEWQEKYAVMTGSPSPRKGVLTPALAAQNPHLKVINETAVQAVSVFPALPVLQENYNEFAQILSRAGMKLISTQEPTAEVLAGLERELNRAVPLR